jgi:hypothetical protein
MCLLTDKLTKSTRNNQGGLDCFRPGLDPWHYFTANDDKLASTKGIPAYIRDASHMPAMKEYLIRCSMETTGRDKSWDEATYESIDWRHYGEAFKQLSHSQATHPDLQVHQRPTLHQTTPLKI